MSAILSSTTSGSQYQDFKVFFRHNQAIIELRLHDSRQRVQQVILKCIQILSEEYRIKMNNNYLHYALYLANNKGGKASDAIQISHSQRIKGLGVRRFYLEYLNFSKESISTEINLQRKYGFQKKGKKQFGGCCAIFGNF